MYCISIRFYLESTDSSSWGEESAPQDLLGLHEAVKMLVRGSGLWPDLLHDEGGVLFLRNWRESTIIKNTARIWHQEV